MPRKKIVSTYQDGRPQKTADELRLAKLLKTKSRQLKASEDQLQRQKKASAQVISRLQSENHQLRQDNDDLHQALRYGGDFQQCSIL
tara:strand:+ start:160 stop:420 length:261 start_codon:yes stop_codon:yes gene_type:complete